ncbi:YtfJ family protein [Nitratiruptor tergarcus]|uniref:YtfJ family protein n=1 Tax=Nitratiruptor tergarcus TaxID=269259 RepID=UPI0013565172|nr:YtfJ family protein [Nitratiruptor tergarcus]
MKDNKKILVKKWGLADQNQDIVIVDKEGKVVFYKAGKLSPKEQERALAILTEKIQND